MKLESGYQSLTPTEDTSQYLKKNAQIYYRGGYTILPGNIHQSKYVVETVLPKLYREKFDSTDVFIGSYPRSGSTWAQEIIWAMIHNANLDHVEGEKHAYEKALFLEFDAIFDSVCYATEAKEYLNSKKAATFLDTIDSLQTPRIFKTHIPIDMLPKSAQDSSKFIYFIRNPMDVCISYYYLSKDMKFLGFKGDQDEFVDSFISGKIHQGSYLGHIKCWARVRDRPNVLTLFYEDLKKDTLGQLKKIDEFLGTNLTAQQFQNVLHYCSFPEMVKRDPLRQSKHTKNEMLQGSEAKGVLRSGNNTSSRDLTAEQRAKIKKHFRENLGDIELPYDFND